ncbi:MAG: tRNA (adenosine(37)-N6)-threonylcarbamoyltransferase complex dimerization subunit type 1 TsaB, partial [Pseudomonadota bacterium]
IEVAMDRAAISAQDLERVVVCTGPGSFTGLRVGISAARGLSLGCAIPGIGVTCFEVMASVMSRAGVLRLPARRGHIYVQSFDASGLPDGPPRLTDGEADPYLVDPLQLAHVGAQRTPGARPAPVYVRGPDADLPREGPPTVLD